MPDDRDPDALSLEPPSLFRRRRRSRPASAPSPEPAPEPEPTEVLAPVPAADPPPSMADEVRAGPPVVRREPRPPRDPRDPPLTGLPAALAAGLVVGLAVVLLTAGGQQGCSAVQGTSSCGGAGYPMILAILIAAGLAGSALLRWAGVPDPGSTSFLAVGLLAVIALLFLVESLESWWMLVVIPLVSAATFAASHWVTTAVIDPARE